MNRQIVIFSRTSRWIPAAVVASICLASCGGNGDSTSATTSSEAHAQQAPKSQPKVKPKSPPDAQEGHVSSRSASFQGGHGPLKELPSYGTEASAAARHEAQASLDGYLLAASRAKWSKACRYIASEVLAQIQQVAGAGAQNGCGPSFDAYFSAAAGSIDLSEYVGAEVRSFRVDGGAGFALIRGPQGEGLWQAMKIENGHWKLTTLVPKAL